MTNERMPAAKKARELAKSLRGEHPDYNYLKQVFRHLRAELEITVPRAPHKLPYVPTEEEIARWEKVRPTMNEILRGKGLVEVAEDKVYVTGMRGPLEEGWQHKVDEFADHLPVTSG
jgi:hypothetical protein